MYVGSVEAGDDLDLPGVTVGRQYSLMTHQAEGRATSCPTPAVPCAQGNGPNCRVRFAMIVEWGRLCNR